MNSYELLRQAILTRRQVLALYQGRRREICPHILGHKNGRARCLAYQFAGETSGGPVQRPGAWKCFDVNELTETDLRDGPWHTAQIRQRVQTCIDAVDLDVSFVGGERPFLVVMAGPWRRPPESPRVTSNGAPGPTPGMPSTPGTPSTPSRPSNDEPEGSPGH